MTNDTDKGWVTHRDFWVATGDSFSSWGYRYTFSDIANCYLLGHKNSILKSLVTWECFLLLKKNFVFSWYFIKLCIIFFNVLFTKCKLLKFMHTDCPKYLGIKLPGFLHVWKPANGDTKIDKNLALVSQQLLC